MFTTVKTVAFGAALCAGALVLPALAQSPGFSPSKITAFVAAGAGGGTDTFARTVQPMLESELGTNVTIINLPAASGALAHQRTATSAPDGEALDFASSTFITSRAAGQNPVGLDQITPVARMQSDVMTLVVDPDRYPDLDAFLEAARGEDGVILGGTHAASVDKMAFLALKQAAPDLNLNFIPYDNEGSASANLLSGNIDGMFNEISAIQGYLEAGEMQPVLALAKERLPGYPDLQTTAENGWDFSFGNERGVFVNAKTDPATVAAIEGALHDIFRSQAYQDYAKRATLDVRPGWLGAEAYRRSLEDDLAFFETLLSKDK